MARRAHSVRVRVVAIGARRSSAVCRFVARTGRAARYRGHVRHVDGAARRARAAAGVVGVVAIGAGGGGTFCVVTTRASRACVTQR
eukprot:COSAG01_NODE_10984_length_2033_cov_6.349535_2_plen_86_part_00